VRTGRRTKKRGRDGDSGENYPHRSQLRSIELDDRQVGRIVEKEIGKRRLNLIVPTAQVANYLADSLLVGEAEQSIVSGLQPLNKATKHGSRHGHNKATVHVALWWNTVKCLKRCKGLAASNGADRWPVSGRLRLGRYRRSQVNGSVLRRRAQTSSRLHIVSLTHRSSVQQSEGGQKWRNKRMTRPHSEGAGDNLRWKSWADSGIFEQPHTWLAVMIQVECGC
jgi:hypothetical protein